MTVAELIKELNAYPQDKTVVVVGHSWVGASEPEAFDSEPFITEEKDKVVIQA